MTDKQIIKPRPICLYEDTCLFLKEKTRLCEDCIHHKNYWSELLEKEQVEKIKSLEQECEELKHKVELMMDCTSCKIDEYKQTLTEIKDISEKEVKRAPDGETFARPEIKQILQKISECEVK